MAVVRDAVAAIWTAPSSMSDRDKLGLFALVVGLIPCRYLEIGSYAGGSAEIVAHAMTTYQPACPGQIVMVEPEPQITTTTWEALQGRATLIQAPSPEALEQARGKFDMVLIDGGHERGQVEEDIQAALGVMSSGFLLFHDADTPGHPGVREAIESALAQNARLEHCFLFSGRRRVGVTWWSHRLLRVNG